MTVISSVVPRIYMPNPALGFVSMPFKLCSITPIDMIGADLRSWVRGDMADIKIDTGVELWTDKSPDENNLSQDTGADQPAFANGAVSGNGSTYYLVNQTDPGLYGVGSGEDPSYTIYTVIRAPLAGAGTLRVLYGFSNAASSSQWGQLFINDSDNKWYFKKYNVGSGAFGASVTGVYQSVVHVVSGTTSKLYINNVQLGSEETVDTAGFTANTFSLLAGVRSIGDILHADFDTKEVIVQVGAAPDATRDAVWAYQQAQFGLQ